nr:hypothetical protein Iba_scaffold18626CG0010 [Ipomoea batatas]
MVCSSSHSPDNRGRSSKGAMQAATAEVLIRFSFLKATTCLIITRILCNKRRLGSGNVSNIAERIALTLLPRNLRHASKRALQQDAGTGEDGSSRRYTFIQSAITCASSSAGKSNRPCSYSRIRRSTSST